jgi:hypothetical protein
MADSSLLQLLQGLSAMVEKLPDSVTQVIGRQGVKERLKPSNILLYYDRFEYVTGDGLNHVLKELDEVLAKKGVPDMNRRSAQNIVFELAFNSLIHRPGDLSDSEFLMIALNNQRVEVWMFGGGRPSQVKRLERIIDSVSKIAQPPHHRAALLAERDARAWRNRSFSASPRRGAGLGMLTIAALSSERLFFLPTRAGRNSSFALKSVV